MNISFHRIASIIAFILGGMATFAGGRILLGNEPGYYVINWLPVYNYSIGILTVFLAAPLIWIQSRFAKSAAISTFGLYTAVMILLQTAFKDVVAPDSIQTMTLRLTVWGIILALMFFQSRRQKSIA